MEQALKAMPDFVTEGAMHFLVRGACGDSGIDDTTAFNAPIASIGVAAANKACPPTFSDVLGAGLGQFSRREPYPLNFVDWREGGASSQQEEKCYA